MPLSSVLAMRQKQFFWLYQQSVRLEAQQDRRFLDLLLASQSPEGVKQAVDALKTDIGVVMEWGRIVPPKFEFTDEDGLDPEFDREGLRALKARHGA